MASGCLSGNGCAGTCTVACAVHCTACSDICQGGCKATCEGNCLSSCETNCYGNCTNQSQSYDIAHCSGYCDGTCTNTCNDSCIHGCNSTCTGTCWRNCDQVCSGSCGEECEGACEGTCEGSSGSSGTTSGGGGGISSGGGESTSQEVASYEELTEQEVIGNDYDDDLFDEQWSLYQNQRSRITSDPRLNKMSLLRGISGMPYQFLPDTDRRIFDKNTTNVLKEDEYLGRKYTERIAQRANILFLTPGKATFLKGVSAQRKRDVVGKMINDIGSQTALFDDDESYRYYSFNFDTTEYYRYLNPMCRAAARYLGLHSYSINGAWTGSKTGLFSGIDGLTHADYEKVLSGSAETSVFTNAYGALMFYLDSVSTSNESISTSLGESNFVNQFIKEPSSVAQEIKFLAGKGVTDLLANDFADNIADPETAKAAQQEIENFVKKYLGNNALAKKLGLGAITVASGGQIIFPKIWNDTTYDTESVNVTIKLSSPDCDAFSIFWNILVPMYAVICMAAPKGYIGIDGYSQPFMIRAFCQSMFMIEAGFITSLSIRKGGEGYWTKDGLPTILEIDMTISDIYNSKFISTSEKGSPDVNLLNPIGSAINVIGKGFQKTPFLKNTAMLNWIANTCGVNVNKPDLIRDIEMYIEHSIENPISDLFTNFCHQLTDTLRNFTPDLLDLLGLF